MNANIMTMFNEIRNECQKANNLLIGMNGEKDKALTALEEDIMDAVKDTDDTDVSENVHKKSKKH